MIKICLGHGEAGAGSRAGTRAASRARVAGNGAAPGLIRFSVGLCPTEQPPARPSAARDGTAHLESQQPGTAALVPERAGNGRVSVRSGATVHTRNKLGNCLEEIKAFLYATLEKIMTNFKKKEVFPFHTCVVPVKLK